MIEFREAGIYCVPADLYIDPWQPVDKAVITHAHSDHARPGMKNYLCHELSEPILRLRLGADINVQTLPYNQILNVGGVNISMHPAGHILGSAQIRLEYKGEIWVISGDYKINDDGLSTPFEPVKCHHFITESTFGLPVYNFRPCSEIYHEVNDWCTKNATAGYNSVLIAYSLGKSQNILRHLNVQPEKIFLHGAVFNINEAYRKIGIDFPGRWLSREIDKKELQGAVIVAPNSVVGTTWLKRVHPYRLGICSGWMALRGARRRAGADKGFVLSDHCDFEQLNTAIKSTGAENIYVTHGYQNIYSKWLQSEYALNAVELQTKFSTTEEEPEEEVKEVNINDE